MSTPTVTHLAPTYGSPPPTSPGGERATVPVRADYLLGLIFDLDRVLADAAQVDWTSDAADSFRGLIDQLRRRRDVLSELVSDLRTMTSSFASLYDDLDHFRRLMATTVLGGLS